MIAEKVLGAYASVGSSSPAEQAEWYRRASREWGINTIELPLLAGVPLPSELAEAFSELRASLVVTLVAQWAASGRKNPAYGLSSVEESAQLTAAPDAYSVLQQCLELSQQGVHIRNVVVHTGQRSGQPVRQAIAFRLSRLEFCIPVAWNAIRKSGRLPYRDSSASGSQRSGAVRREESDRSQIGGRSTERRDRRRVVERRRDRVPAIRRVGTM